MVGGHIYANLELRLQFFHVGAFIENIGGRRVNRRLSLSAYLHVRLEDIPPLTNKDVIITKTRTVAVVCVIYCSTHQQNKQSDQRLLIWVASPEKTRPTGGTEACVGERVLLTYGSKMTLPSVALSFLS